MKAVTVHTYGGSEVLEVHTHVDDPVTEKNQVRIRIHAASINPFDLALVSGIYKDTIPLSFPMIPGGDIAGIVERVDENTKGVAVGDEVFGSANALSGGTGALAELAVTSADRLAKKPRSASFLQAAALPLVGTSAIQAVEEHMRLTANQKILIHGGAGGIGHIAIQLAKHIGAHVATTVSADDFAFAKSLGADEVIDYKNQKFETMLSGFDAAYDTVGGAVTNRSFGILRKGGVLVSMKGPPDEERARRQEVTAIGQNTKITSARLDRLSGLVDSGAITVHVDQMYPLEKIRDAWNHAKSGRQKGKVVIGIR